MPAGLFFESIAQDARYAIRGFLRTPAFTLTAILAATLGIGASSAVFSVVDRILFRSLPYPDDGRLVSAGIIAPLDSQEFLFGAAFLDWRDHPGPFAALTSWSGISDCDLTERNPARLRCVEADASFVPTFGVQPLLGRSFTREEDRPNGPEVALLFHSLWQSRFAGSRDVLGKTMSVDGRTATIIGVLPAGFELPGLSSADVLIPQRMDEASQRNPGPGRLVRVFGRLKPGVSIPQAEAAMQPRLLEFIQSAPPAFRKEIKLRIRSMRDRQFSDVKLASWVLLGGVLSVLLIACANIANLLLARSAARRRELAVRAALGAGRARLIRQTLTESVLLGLAGGAAGCALGTVLLRLFLSIAPAGIPGLAQASLDPRVLLFSLAGSILCGLLFGIAPALEQRSVSDYTGARSTSSAGAAFRRTMVAAQLAISLVLLTGAGLLLHSFWNMSNVPLGMRTEHIVTATVALPRTWDAQRARELAFIEEVEDRLRRIPGIGELAVTDKAPPAGGTRSRPYFSLEVEGRPRFAGGTGGMVSWRTVTPGYFTALGIPIVRGRAFNEEDRRPDQRSMILSQMLAARLFPNEDPVGKRIQLVDGARHTVVGVAADVRSGGLKYALEAEYYVAARHSVDDARRTSTVIARSPMDPRAVAEWIRSEIHGMDATLPVEVDTMQAQVSKLADRPRFNAVLLGLFAGIGILLAAIGLYGVMSFLVAQRVPEIGVRMALGATPGSVAKLVLSQAARWTIAGALAGIAGSIAAERLLGALLFQVPKNDPWSLGGAVGLLMAIALMAAWLPARRAARVDPAVALRRE
ncbi:MAG: ABC transporter permease [Acidobacteriota bacterium]|nr:ABC transporter permease [Acidobacteriota bacterium]